MPKRLPILFVEQNYVYIIQRLGKFNRLMESGLRFKIPFFQEVRYEFSLKQQVKEVQQQAAITKDNVKLSIDGILYYRIVDAKKAAYNVRQPVSALVALAQTSMRSQIGKIDLDHTFRERATLNVKIKEALNQASQKWGIQCMRYEIKDIHPPKTIMRSMELQAESERTKRSQILQSEGRMQSVINVAQGNKRSAILNGDGQAQKVLQEARSICESLDAISKTLSSSQGMKALKLKLTEQYLEVLGRILSQVNVLMLPGRKEGAPQNGNEIKKLVAQGTQIYKSVSNVNGISLSGMSNESIGQKLIDTAAQEVFNLKAEESSSSVQNKGKQHNQINKKGFSDRLLEIK